MSTFNTGAPTSFPADSQVYWQNRLANFAQPENVKIPKLSHQSNSISAYHTIPFILAGSNTTLTVQTFCAALQIFPMTFYISVWAHTLRAYSDSDDFLIGLQLPQGTLPIRISFKTDACLQTFLLELQTQIVESLEHIKSLPVTIEALLKDTNTCYTGFYAEGHNVLQQALFLHSAPNAHALSISYDTKTYAAETIIRLQNYIVFLIQRFANQATTQIMHIPLVTPDEYQRQIHDYNNTTVNIGPAQTFHKQFELAVHHYANKAALLLGNETLTYQALNERANQLAHYLQACGIKAGDCVAISLNPSFELLIGMIAILKLGATYVPLDASYPAERLAYMLDDTQAQLLVTDTLLQPRFCNHPVAVICVDADHQEISGQPIHNLAYQFGQDHLAYIIYTSGSTGKPKGVMVTLGNLENFFYWYGNATETTEADVIDFSSSVSFDFTVPATLFPLVKGASIAICPELAKKDPGFFLQHLAQHKISITKLTPSYFRQLKKFVRISQPLLSLRLIVFGGEQLYAKDISDWLTYYPQLKILNEYGPTETTVATSWVIVDAQTIQDYQHAIPIGKPAANTQLYVLNKQLKPLPQGVSGELFIGGCGVARGYLNRPDVTAEKFLLNPFRDDASRMYRTGDVCRQLADGSIEFIERLDHQVKIRGYRIEMSEIEVSLAKYPNIAEAVVIAYIDPNDDTAEKKLVAYYVLHDISQPFALPELVDFLHQQLPLHMIPTFFMPLDTIPLTVNGKLDRLALPTPTIQTEQTVAPQSVLEQLIHDVWAECLNITNIGIDANFFSLGGHSLSAARIINKLMALTLKELTLDNLYRHPTISSLAIVIDQAPQKRDALPDKVKLKKRLPLSEMQFIMWMASLRYPNAKGMNIVDRRRIDSWIDANKLQQAFQQLLQKHTVLTHYIPRFLPLQYGQTNLSLVLTENNLLGLSAADQEKAVTESIQHLENYTAWQKHKPLLVAHLIHLNDGVSELQICLSHYVGDEISTAIIFNELSYFYSQPLHSPLPVNTFQTYVLAENAFINKQLADDAIFWQDYLRSVDLFCFPEDELIPFTSRLSISCTSHVSFAQDTLGSLRDICREKKITLSECLYAAVSLVLANYTEASAAKANIVLNLVKSTRDNDIYDNAVGFFVRTDLLRVEVGHADDLLATAKQVQQALLVTAPHQFCPSIVKLAYVFQAHWAHKKWRNAAIMGISCLYSLLFPQVKANPRVLTMYGRMFLAGVQNNFLVNVNIMNNFLNSNWLPHNTLFGGECLPVKNYFKERIHAENVIEVCFDRDNFGQPFIAVSGNLTAELRQRLGKEIIANLQNILQGVDLSL